MADKEKKLNKAETKSDKPKKEKKKGRIKNAWKGFVSETKKVVWPSWKQVLKNTGIVLVIVTVFALAIFALDWAFNSGFEALVDLITKK